MADFVIILTILSLILGIYTILPETKKFRLGYSVGALEKCILVYSMFVMLVLSLLSAYLAYHAQDASVLFLGFDLKCLYIVDIGQLITAVIIVATVIAIFLESDSVIHNIEYFNEKLEELWQKQHYTSFFTLLRENCDQIFRSNQSGSNQLLQYIDTKLTDDQFIQTIVRYEPDLGLKIALAMPNDNYSKSGYTDAFIKELLQNKKSKLHYEIADTQSIQLGYSRRYLITNNNNILFSLISHIKVAEDIRVWRPIGEGVIEILDEQYEKESDEYNRCQRKFSDYKERCADPIFAGIAFFDLMVTEALYQKASWHMWLYYYSHFVAKICRNYRNDSLCEPDSEFPNTYAWMLDQIISNLADWIRIIEDDADKIECALEDMSCDHENNNIIKSSIICLSQCIRTIIASENILDPPKKSYVDSCFMLYFDLKLSGNKAASKYATVFMNCITDKCLGEDHPEYIIRLQEYFKRFDIVPYEFEEGGKEVISSFRSLLQENSIIEHTT